MVQTKYYVKGEELVILPQGFQRNRKYFDGFLKNKYFLNAKNHFQVKEII